MPVTARLSRGFYERFGDQLVNELVDWMNSVDLSYRQDLLQINDANVERFNATLDARAAELRGEMDRAAASIRADMNKGFADIRAELNQGLADVRAELNQGLADVRGEMHKGFANVDLRLAAMETRFAQFEARMLKWMLVFWATTLATLVALK